jgi:hypothetical protein
VAAAATPVVAAALITLALLASGCRSWRPARDVAPAPDVAPPSNVAPASDVEPTPASAPVMSAGPAGLPAWTAPPDGSAARLLLVVGGPAQPRAAVHDLARPDWPSVPLALPNAFDDGGLATVVAAPDGRLAAIGQDGMVWTARVPDAGGGGQPGWVAFPADGPGPPAAGPVLGATWSVDGSALILVAGAPGSGRRRTAIITRTLIGTTATRIDLPLEADGPSIAALPRGVVAFVGRDLRDRGLLARVTASDSFATVPVAARGATAGGDLVALVGDASVLVGSLADLERGVLPSRPLPLLPGGGVGHVAIAGDGSGVAVIRLDDQGVATRVEVVRRTAGGWTAGPAITLDARDATAIPAWLP